MFGITPMPIYDPLQTVSYLREFMVFFKPGDIVKWRPIDREEYDQSVVDVNHDRFEPRISDVNFSLDEFNNDIESTNANLLKQIS